MLPRPACIFGSQSSNIPNAMLNFCIPPMSSSARTPAVSSGFLLNRLSEWARIEVVLFSNIIFITYSMGRSFEKADMRLNLWYTWQTRTSVSAIGSIQLPSILISPLLPGRTPLPPHITPITRTSPRRSPSGISLRQRLALLLFSRSKVSIPPCL